MQVRTTYHQVGMYERTHNGFQFSPLLMESRGYLRDPRVRLTGHFRLSILDAIYFLKPFSARCCFKQAIIVTVRVVLSGD